MQTHYDAYGRERAWSRQEKRDASLERWQALHPGERVPSIVEAAERGQIEAEADQAAMERGECCGRCSASGLCGSSRWGWLWIHYRSGHCPFSDVAIMRELLPKEDWSYIWEALDRAKDNGNGE